MPAALFRQVLPTIVRLNAAARASDSRDGTAWVVLAWVLAAAVLVSGLIYGSDVAGGADAFGYVSASVLWRSGALGIDQHALASLPWPSAEGSFVPLAYRLGTGGVIGPTVAPGLPLLMALARSFSVCGPYLVVPLCAGILVLATFELGRRLFSTGAALAAAAVMACSPVILFQSLVVMADVPAAALWTSALAAALSKSGRGVLLSGALAGMAVLIRPNLVPLLLFPCLLVAVRSDTRGHALRRTALFAVSSMPAALCVGWINLRLYGSPFASGYANVAGAFALHHAPTNVRLYAQWWLESQGAAAFLFLIALFRPRRPNRREVSIVVAYAACAALLYVFYLPFDQWWYLRFLVPAIPIVFLLCVDVIDWSTARSPLLRVTALVAFVVVAASHAMRFVDSKDIFSNSVAERRRYLDAARYLDRQLPPDAVVLAMQHSGSVRYYAGRLTMRWDTIDAASLDAALAALDERGIHVFALLESWEEEEFRRRFAGRRVLSALTTAVARTIDNETRLYALDRGPQAAATAAVIPPVDDGCIDASPHFVRPVALRRLAGK